jgi:FkbM family methyltransferase
MGEIQIVFDRFIFPHFYFFHSWELELVEFMSDYSQNSPYKKTTFVDIGAHVGLISKQIQIRNPDFNFILVEPNISNFDLLRTNITENVIYINRVVSNIDQKEIKLFIDRSNSGNSSTNFISTEFYNVKSIRLNDIFENLIKSSDANVILKLDCEGSDMELFNSLSSDNRLKLTAAVIEIVKTEQIIIDKFIPLLSEFNHFYFSQPNILRKRNRITKIDLSHLKHFLESLKVGEEINLFFTR